jgi:hypothetical protein
MNKKLWIGFVAVFVATQTFEGLANFTIFDPLYRAAPHIWRPIAEVKFWLLPVTGMFFSFFFVYIFSKGYEKKGVLEGVRYGIFVALMIALPSAYERYALMQIPYSLALQWFLFRSLECVIAGAILSGIFKLPIDSSAQA